MIFHEKHYRLNQLQEPEDKEKGLPHFSLDVLVELDFLVIY